MHGHPSSPQFHFTGSAADQTTVFRVMVDRNQIIFPSRPTLFIRPGLSGFKIQTDYVGALNQVREYNTPLATNVRYFLVMVWSMNDLKVYLNSSAPAATWTHSRTVGADGRGARVWTAHCACPQAWCPGVRGCM